MLVFFRPNFVNYCPSNLLSARPLCGWEGAGGVELRWRLYSAGVLTLRTYKIDTPTPNKNLGGGPQRDKHLPQSPFRDQLLSISLTLARVNLPTMGKASFNSPTLTRTKGCICLSFHPVQIFFKNTVRDQEILTIFTCS